MAWRRAYWRQAVVWASVGPVFSPITTYLQKPLLHFTSVDYQQDSDMDKQLLRYNIRYIHALASMGVYLNHRWS